MVTLLNDSVVILFSSIKFFPITVLNVLSRSRLTEHFLSLVEKDRLKIEGVAEGDLLFMDCLLKKVRETL